jgi:hypothetical protein
MTAALPPAGAWATPAELAAALRIAVTDANGAALAACCDAAAIEIVDAIDAADLADLPGPTDALCGRVNLLRAVEWWKANDAAFGLIGMGDTGALRVPRDAFARHASMLLPHKRRFGVA